MLSALVLLVLAAIALERAGWLPRPLAELVQSAEGWLEPLLHEAGIELPSGTGEPQAEAHRSGGHAWGRERRAAYANDLGNTRALIAVSASANRSKGGQGPEE